MGLGIDAEEFIFPDAGLMFWIGGWFLVVMGGPGIFIFAASPNVVGTALHFHLDT